MNEQEAKRLCALRELVRETFAQTLMIRTDTISDTADFFDELGGDSLDSLDVAVHLEEICGQRVPEEEYALCRCVEDAALLLLRLEQGGDAEKVPEEPHSVTPVTRFEDTPEYAAFQQRLRTADETGNPYFLCNDSPLRDTSLHDGREILNFSSYNYAGMSGRPETVKAAQQTGLDILCEGIIGKVADAAARQVIEKAGYGKIPVLSLNFSGLEKDSSMPMDLKFMRQALAAIYYGDLLMTLRAQTQPYELEAGAAERLQNKWLDILCDEVRHDKGYSGREMKAVMPKIAVEFAAIPVRRVPKVKVGVVGEIYVKYSPLGNNELEKFLASQDCEVNLPGLMGFVQYCAYNMAETVRLYGGSLVEKTAAEAALALIAGMEKVIIKTLKDAGYHAPMPFSELIKLPEQSHTIGMGCKMGEGWLLTAEMLELIHSGTPNIVCAQPFGCLPNHITGKGVLKELKRIRPHANLMAVDYDPGSSEANQLNRIKLFMTVAHSRIPQEAQGDHAPASLNESVAQLAGRLRDNLKGKLENTIGGSGNSGDEVTNLA